MHSDSCVLGRGHHCGACHVTFGTLSLFDVHRVGHVDNRQCIRPPFLPNPADKRQRLRLAQDAHGVWQTLAGLEARVARADGAREARRRARQGATSA